MIWIAHTHLEKDGFSEHLLSADEATVIKYMGLACVKWLQQNRNDFASV